MITLDQSDYIRNLYRQFGPPKPMGSSAGDLDKPHFFLHRKFLGEQDLAILFNTKRCRYQCRFCSLPAKSSQEWIDAEHVVNQFVYVTNELRHSLGVLDRFTIANEGSVFDELTYPVEALQAIVSATRAIPNLWKIVIETRIEFATVERMRAVKEWSGGKTLDVLTGFETLDTGIRDCAAIVIGGGDIVVPWSTSSRYWERAYLRRPVFVAGVGVPTWRSPEPHVVARLRSFFGHANVRFVGSRDAESSAWIERHLQPSVPVATAPDLVCGLTLPVVERPAGPPIFGVAVRSRKEKDDLTQVRRLCERATALGYRVRRIVLATGRVRTRDLEATADLGLPDTELVSSDDLATITRAIGECTAMTSMKFHGVVVATMFGIPTIATMPTAKTRNFLRGIGRADLLSAYSNPDLPSRLDDRLAPIDLATREELRSRAVAHLAALRERIIEQVDGRTVARGSRSSPT